MEKVKSLEEMFNNGKGYELDGCWNGNIQSIDRDQAIDDDGAARYDWFEFINLETGEKTTVTAAEMEAFARTW